MKGKPIPLITVDDEGVFSVNEEALKIIESTQEPVAVATVVGLYRTGKSFLLNQLIEDSSTEGFEVGPTIQPCTKGLWMWAHPISMSNSKCQNFKLILIDTEGISSFAENETHDAQIFALSILLSSFFIYNSLGNIDESAISRLSLVTEVTKIIRANSSKDTSSQSANDDNNADDISEYFPSFLWVVRDFVLQLKKDGEEISAKEYLEAALQLQRGDSEHVKAKNRVRQSIKDCFKKRDCFTLVRPVTEEQDFHKISSLQQRDLRPKFRDQIGNLKEYLFSAVSPKKMNGHFITGEMLAPLVRAYVKSINKGIVVISSAWDNLVQTQCEKAFTNALTEFKNNLDSLVKNSVMEPLEFETKTNEYEAVAWRKFNRGAIGSDEKQQFEDQLKDAMQELYSKYRERLRRSSNKLCVQTLNELFLPIDKRIHAPSSNNPPYKSFDEFVQDWKSITKEYMNSTKGPEKANVMVSAIQKWFFPSSQEVHQNLLRSEKQSKEKEIQEKYKPQQQKLENHISELEETIQQYENNEKEYEDQLENERNNVKDKEQKCKKLEQENKKSKQEYDNLKEEKESLQNKKIEIEHRAQKAEYSQTKLSQENNSLKQTIEDFESKQENANQEIRDLKERLGQSNREQSELRATNRYLEDSLDDLKESKAQVDESIQQYQSQNSQLQYDLDQQKSENEELNKQINDYKKQIESLKNDNDDSKKTIAKLRGEVDNAQESLKCSSLENDSISQAFRVVKFERSKLADSIQDYQNEIESLQTEKNRLKEKLEHQEKMANKEKQDLEQRIKDLERELKESNYKLKAKTVEMESLKTHQETDLAAMRNSLRESSLMRASKLEKQVEDLNLTNRRVLKINRKVMEENEKMRHKMLKLLNEFKLNPSSWVNDIASLSSESQQRRVHRLSDIASTTSSRVIEAGKETQSNNANNHDDRPAHEDMMNLSPVLPVNERKERAKSNHSSLYIPESESPVKQNSMHLSGDRVRLAEEEQNQNGNDNYRYGSSRLFNDDTENTERDEFVENWLSRSLSK